MDFRGILLVIFILILFYILIKVIYSQSSPLSTIQDGTTMTTFDYSKLSGGSSGANAGNFTYSVWFYVNDWNYRYGEPKVVFGRMGSSSTAATSSIPGVSGLDPCPSVVLGAIQNNLSISLACYPGTGSESSSSAHSYHGQANTPNIPAPSPATTRNSPASTCASGSGLGYAGSSSTSPSASSSFTSASAAATAAATAASVAAANAASAANAAKTASASSPSSMSSAAATAASAASAAAAAAANAANAADAAKAASAKYPSSSSSAASTAASASASSAANSAAAAAAAANAAKVASASPSSQPSTGSINSYLSNLPNIERFTSMSSSSVVHTCNVANVPIQKWVNLLISVYGRTLDVYIDGKLVKTCLLPGIAKINNKAPVYLTPSGGFSGWTSNLQYWPNSTDPQTAWNIYSSGYGSSNVFGEYKVKVAVYKGVSEQSSLTI